MKKQLSFIASILALQSIGFSQELYPLTLPQAPWHNEHRELRYRPDGTDFVITNGNRLFTRALYGTHTAFRVETGDRPEFALYVPGMGGNIKLGIGVGDSSKWLTQARTITARYRPGSMVYTIEDGILGNGKLTITVLAMADAEGMVVQAKLQDANAPIALFVAFGGATGKKFSRDGDMGPDPESVFYLKPENCKDNSYTVDKNSFILKYGAGLQVGQDGRYFVEDLKQAPQSSKEQQLVALFPTAAQLKLGDALQADAPANLFASAVGKAPMSITKIDISNNQDYYFSVHNPATKPAFQYPDAAKVFAQAETARRTLASRITIKTPDAFMNTIGGALAIASDAVWEEPSYLHGAIGWRMRLNGWRGAYTADALGWHDRAKMHLAAYARSQVTTPASGAIVADTSMHLSRSLEKLGTGMFTSGYISRDPNGKNLRAHHYDMNLVYIDILLRHYAWTGDMAFLKETWPVIKRHLEWETRNFDADGDGLYDAYAAIWASDALQYSGGGVTHSSAYNYYAYKKAAEIATLLGEDAAPFRKESEKILAAMNQQLWMQGKGSFAEYKDALGNKSLHPSAALWTIYHSMDSETMDPFQAYESMRYIDEEIPHIPVRAQGLEDKGYYTLATTSWMPYTWSLNNSALAESMHTILANWQAGRKDEAFKLFKSEVLASMYLGGSPGNIVQISHFDAIRGEAYRDFGDPVGMFSRALVEGLFGIVPDALHKQFTIKPGFPADWGFASFATPDISFDFKRTGQTDKYQLIPKFPTALDLRLQVVAQGQIKTVLVNGKPAAWKNLPGSIGKPMIEVSAPATKRYDISITWQGNMPILPSTEKIYTTGDLLKQPIPLAKVLELKDPQNTLSGIRIDASGISAKIIAGTGHYTVFAKMGQQGLSWWMPICFEVVEPITLLSSNSDEANASSFKLVNNGQKDIAANVLVNGFPTKVSIAKGQTSPLIEIDKKHLVTGTNDVTIDAGSGNIYKEKLIDWSAQSSNKMESIDLSPSFNDVVTQIFKNKYLSPRPRTTTLQLPWQGTGDWPHPLETHDIDDSGLRRLAGDSNHIVLPQGVAFSTPGTSNSKNIIFTSQWDNYPKEATILLTGKSSHAWFLMAGSTNPMQSQFNNGVVTITYTDGTTDSLLLRNPETWWPIEKDYYTDGFAFALKQPRPIRIHLKTGTIVAGEISRSNYNGKEIPGGAATVLDLPLDGRKTLESLTLKTLANDVVIGLMAVTLSR